MNYALEHVVTLESLFTLWGHFGVAVGSIWNHFGVTLKLLWGHFEFTLGLLLGDFEITLGSFGVILESL